MSDLSNIFSSKYERNEWGNGSGPGSDPDNCRPYMVWLQELVNSNPCGRIIDVGCGDWQHSRFIDWSPVTYIGVDVVPSVVQYNELHYKREGIEFLCMPGDRIRPKTTDIILCKDVWQHLSFSQIGYQLEAFSGASVIYVANGFPYDAQDPNADCKDGGYRPLNLLHYPFTSLKAEKVLDFGRDDGKEICKRLYRLIPHKGV